MLSCSNETFVDFEQGRIVKPFIGRKIELDKLKDLALLRRASLVVIKGRRRIGKSRLAAKYAEDKIFLPFTGLAPVKGVKAQNQRDTFARQFAQNFNLPPFTFTDWDDAFAHVSKHLSEKTTVILFDEISWMGSKDPTFIPKLKAWWDLALQQHPNVTLILCGSVSTWISKNIINSTAFFGRISLLIDLPELSLSEAYQFLKTNGTSRSTYDVFKILSVTGGVPWYLEQVASHQTADDNLKKLCFEKDGLLVGEFDRIFNDLFNKRSTIYKRIIRILADGMRTLSQIRDELNYPQSGSMSDHIKALVTSGFVTQHYSWSIKTKKMRKEMLYRLSDNYLRFFIKYIEPNFPKIENNTFQDLSLGSLPGWEAMMGFQVENLLLKNRALLLKMLGLNPADIVADNPYIQFPTQRQKGCQIDYLIQTHANNLFVCEFKFKKKEINSDVIESVQDKIHRFSVPKGYGICPVLVHLSEVSNTVHEQHFFYRIIDISDFLI